MKNRNSKIFVAGHKGLVGSAIVRKLKEKNYKRIITIDKSKLDLTDQRKVLNFFKKKNTNLYLLQQQKWVEYILTISLKLTLFTAI